MFKKKEIRGVLLSAAALMVWLGSGAMAAAAATSAPKPTEGVNPAC